MKLSGLLRWGIGVILLIVVVGITLSNYLAGMYMAIGSGILIGLGLLIRSWGWRRVKIIAALIIGILVVFMVLISDDPVYHYLVTSCNDGDVRSVVEVTAYKAEIEPTSFAKGSFRVSEHITFDQLEDTCINARWHSEVLQGNVEYNLPSRTIQGVKSGLFVNEVRVPSSLSGYKCCPSNAAITLDNLPYNSFYDALFARDLKVDEYLGDELITWQTSNLDEGLRFAYLPPPYYNLRVLVIPFIDLAKNENWLLALFGFAVSSVFLYIIKPNIVGFTNEKVKKIFVKRKRPQQRKVVKRRLNRNL